VKLFVDLGLRPAVALQLLDFVPYWPPLDPDFGEVVLVGGDGGERG
jgi:hypothetical protein